MYVCKHAWVGQCLAIRTELLLLLHFVVRLLRAAFRTSFLVHDRIVILLAYLEQQVLAPGPLFRLYGIYICIYVCTNEYLNEWRSIRLLVCMYVLIMDALSLCRYIPYIHTYILHTVHTYIQHTSCRLIKENLASSFLLLLSGDDCSWALSFFLR